MNDNIDKWLDEIISRTINTEKPQFDAEQWKQKFPDEYRILQSRKVQQQASSIQRLNIFKSPIIKFATAAVIILAVGLFISQSGKNEKIKIDQMPSMIQSPAEMLTLRSLTIAYRKGGIEAVETQCDKAIEKLGLKSKRQTIKQLLADFDGA
jgi:hypothetical protein